MTLDELVDKETKEQQDWLAAEIAAGKTPEDIYAELGTDKAGLGKFGIFWVPPKKAFMIKPMRGYQTTKLSGNEKANDAGIQGGNVIK